MSDNMMIFIIIIVAIATVGSVLKTVIRGPRRFAGRTGVEAEIEDQRTVAKLTEENARLTARLARQEERIAVLERIATDPADRTAREIEALR